MLISNNVSYSDSNPGAKTIIQIKEPNPSVKFIELTMFGDVGSKKFIVALNNGTGYSQLYANDQSGWSTDNSVFVTYGDNRGLTVTDGKKTVIDKLPLNGFNLGSISVYGKGDSTLPDSALGGAIKFGVVYGNSSKVLDMYPIKFVNTTTSEQQQYQLNDNSLTQNSLSSNNETSGEGYNDGYDIGCQDVKEYYNKPNWETSSHSADYIRGYDEGYDQCYITRESGNTSSLQQYIPDTGPFNSPSNAPSLSQSGCHSLGKIIGGAIGGLLGGTVSGPGVSLTVVLQVQI